MSTTEVPVDIEVLREEIRKTYTEVSTEQEHEFIFPTGRSWAHELNYPEPELSRMREKHGARKEQHMRKPLAGAAVLSIAAVAAIGVVGSASAAPAAPSKVVVKQKSGMKMVPNRYIQDEMRFDRDVYKVASGGTVEFRMTAPQDGPHTLTVVAAKDLPRTAEQAFNCKACNRLGKAHGADPSTETPPKFKFLENGVGQNAAPRLDRPGDSGFLPAQRGAKITFKVTAPKGTTLRLICLVHPWMQATLLVR